MFDLEERLRSILRRDSERMAALQALRGPGLPQAAIGAGYVRTAVWDAITGREHSPVADIDVLYFDPADLRRDAEAAVEGRLRDTLPDLPWSVRNQARMHLRNGDPPYRSVEDALAYWLETPTCVAVRLADDSRIEVIAPHGLDDLFALRIRPTPAGRRRAAEYRQRIANKRWTETWTEAVIEMP
ncbi:MAG: nucleotidyltransferase family protein [Alphaproteobacteria bacterium]|nr:nucleotidyltransferase family protein [Alphaproteobacteria bacterium]